MALDPRLATALEEQLRSRDAAFRGGARRVGWKLGMGNRERIGEHIATGYLTTDTVVAPGGRYCVAPESDHELHVDTEICVEFGRAISIKAQM